MLNFTTLKFSELTLDQLYEILRLRQEVFIVEQDCPYLDTDGKDQGSYHVIGVDKNSKIQAYTRLVPPGVSYDGYSSIGRVVTSSAIRGHKQGKPLMQHSISSCQDYWPQHDIKISAQTYILKFYNDLGFIEVGDEYLEDGIPHNAMVRKVRN